ncbi:MAG: hypothetical protein MHM6MM_002913 [Cercozoa sp. M6MM]
MRVEADPRARVPSLWQGVADRPAFKVIRRDWTKLLLLYVALLSLSSVPLLLPPHRSTVVFVICVVCMGLAPRFARFLRPALPFLKPFFDAPPVILVASIGILLGGVVATTEGRFQLHRLRAMAVRSIASLSEIDVEQPGTHTVNGGIMYHYRSDSDSALTSDVAETLDTLVRVTTDSDGDSDYLYLCVAPLRDTATKKTTDSAVTVLSVTSHRRDSTRFQRTCNAKHVPKTLREATLVPIDIGDPSLQPSELAVATRSFRRPQYLVKVHAYTPEEVIGHQLLFMRLGIVAVFAWPIPLLLALVVAATRLMKPIFDLQRNAAQRARVAEVLIDTLGQRKDAPCDDVIAEILSFRTHMHLHLPCLRKTLIYSYSGSGHQLRH